MKQSICYLYEYENNKQIKNVGFVKCVFQKTRMTFQIHGKGLECDKFMNLEMFLFTSDSEKCELDYVGEVEGNMGKVNYIVSIEDMDFARLNEYDGVMLESKNKKKYIASWTKKEIHLEKTTRVQEECVLYEEEKEKFACETKEEEEDYRVEQVEMEFQEVVKREIEEALDDTNELELKYRKINRQGIADLPQREWKLANNNFLLHGFTNYNHLMFIREKEQLYLGVPGIYHSKEETAAKSFGFPMFHEIDGKLLALEEGEYDTQARFGYWCRPVSERRRMDPRYGRRENRD